jgi:hypothetical protein
MLEAIADPKHARHAELTEWIRDDFDPTAARPSGSRPKLMSSPGDGRANARESAPAVLDPRLSPEGLDLPSYSRGGQRLQPLLACLTLTGFLAGIRA